MRACSPDVGDWTLMLGVLDYVKLGPGWEHFTAESADMVVEALRRVEVTPSLMQEVFGKSWSTVLYLCRRMVDLSEEDCRKIASVVEMRGASPAWRSAEADMVDTRPHGMGAVWSGARMRYWTRASMWRATSHISGWETFDWVHLLAEIAVVRWRVDAEPFPSWPRSSYEELTSPWRMALGDKFHPLD
jgi:hypothetical protein